MSMSSKNYTNLALHDPTNEITNRHNQNMKHMRLKTYSNSQRAQGGMGLLSHENSVQDLHKTMAKILPRREKGGRTWRERRGEGRMAASSLFLFLCSVQHTHQGEEVLLLFQSQAPQLPAASLPCLPSLLLKDYNTPKC